jgi:hypothetical protein
MSTPGVFQRRVVEETYIPPNGIHSPRRHTDGRFSLVAVLKASFLYYKRSSSSKRASARRNSEHKAGCHCHSPSRGVMLGLFRAGCPLSPELDDAQEAGIWKVSPNLGIDRRNGRLTCLFIRRRDPQSGTDLSCLICVIRLFTISLSIQSGPCFSIRCRIDRS